MKRFPYLLTDCHWNGTANPVLCFLNPHQIIFTYFSIAHTVKKTSFFVLSTTTVQVKGDGWSPLQPLGASKEVSKSKRNGADLAKSNRKVFSSHWGLHNKKHGKVCPQLPPIFPASTVLNAGIAGDTVEAILYRVEVMALIIYLQILLLFLPQLQKFYFYYDESVQLQISIYFQFYHNLITLKQTLLLLILSFIFRFKNFF